MVMQVFNVRSANARCTSSARLVAVAAVVLPSRGVMYVVASRWVIGVLRSILCLVGQLCV